MINYTKKLIFIHIPKCGGTSVENALFTNEEKIERNLFTLKGHPKHDLYEQGGLQHLSAIKVKEIITEEIYDNFYKFSVVRNPIDKLISQYNYTNQFIDFYSYLNLKPNNFSFSEYLNAICNKYHVHWRPQHEFIFNDKQELLVDEVFKLENIKNGKLEEKLGVKLPHHNKSYKHIESITEKDESIIKNIFSKDFELLQY